MLRQYPPHRVVILLRDGIERFLARKANVNAEFRRNFFGKNFDVETRVDDRILQFRFVEIALECQLRDNEFAAPKHFDVRDVFDTLTDELETLRKRKFALVFLDDEYIQSLNLPGGGFDQMRVPERKRIAIHHDASDLQSLAPKIFFEVVELSTHAARNFRSRFVF